MFATRTTERCPKAHRAALSLVLGGLGRGWLWGIAIVVTALTLLPGVYLGMRVVEAGAGESWRIYASSRTAELVTGSVALVAGVTLVAVVLGVGLAFLVERTDLPGRAIARVALALPLAIPSYIAAYAWVSTFGFQGYWAAVGVLGLGTYPYVFLPVSAALRRWNQSLEDVARTLGRGRWSTFVSVTVPHVRPSATAGALLVALYTLSDFGAVSLLRFDSFTRAIFMSYKASFDRTAAAVLAVALLAVTLVITVIEARVRGRAAEVSAAQQRAGTPARLGAWRFPALALVWGTLGLALAYPLAVVAGWTLAGRSAGLGLADLAGAAWSTVWVCAVAAAVIVVACLPIGWLGARQESRAIGLVHHCLYLAHALPGLVVALAMTFIGIRLVPSLYQRTPLLIVTYLVLFAPLAVGAIRSAVAQSARRLEEVSLTLGLGPVATFRSVTLPLAAPGVASAFLLVMLTAMKELPATLLLRPTGMETLATRLWMYTDELAYAAAAPYGLALVVAATVPTLALTIAQKERS